MRSGQEIFNDILDLFSKVEDDTVTLEGEILDMINRVEDHSEIERLKEELANKEKEWKRRFHERFSNPDSFINNGETVEVENETTWEEKADSLTIDDLFETVEDR